MPAQHTVYDVVIAGAGHNGLIAACYLAGSGLSVLVLERSRTLGGAAVSKKVFPGMDANLSVYAYLVSLLPPKVLSDLNLKLEQRPRAVSSWSPYLWNCEHDGLLIHATSSDATNAAFRRLTGDTREARGYQRFREITGALTKRLWPTLIEPLPTRDALKQRLRTKDEKLAWELLVEQPLGRCIEQYLQHDLTRGLVFTDATIGVLTQPHDPSMVQNRTFLYHTLGNGTGEWCVPVGGIGQLIKQLTQYAKEHGSEIIPGAAVTAVEPSAKNVTVAFSTDQRESTVEAKFLLANAAPEVLGNLLPAYRPPPASPGSVLKLNLLLERLPQPRARIDPSVAFNGTVHLDEGYRNIQESYECASIGQLPKHPPGEMYCHTLTDQSILSPELAGTGYHTLTYFGLDMPYSVFAEDNDGNKRRALQSCVASINRYLAEPLEECVARDNKGDACIQVLSPVDIEETLGMPQGNIFHGDLCWPFSESDEDRWGVETGVERVFLCGSGARRGGCVSGIPGHNAAMKVLECLGGLDAGFT